LSKRSITGDLHLADIPTILVFTASDICSGPQPWNFNPYHTLPTCAPLPISQRYLLIILEFIRITDRLP
ncbi:MAG: hypothetical protein AB2822_17240, partial [Candidatus Thiodiazotropha endolucinida]